MTRQARRNRTKSIKAAKRRWLQNHPTYADARHLKFIMVRLLQITKRFVQAFMKAWRRAKR